MDPWSIFGAGLKCRVYGPLGPIWSLESGSPWLENLKRRKCTAGASVATNIVWSHVPSIAAVSDTSSIPQHDAASCFGLHVCVCVSVCVYICIHVHV